MRAMRMRTEKESHPDVQNHARHDLVHRHGGTLMAQRSMLEPAMRTLSGWLLGALLIGFALWCLWQFWPARIVFDGPLLLKKHRFRVEKMPLAELAEIRFHYHAVVGFLCVWEFVSVSGQSISVDGYRISGRLLARLERHVPGFSSRRFRAAFEAGDVEDTLEVWRAPAADPPVHPGGAAAT